MLGIYDSLKKLIDKCDLYFDGHIISKELLVKNYADFLASNFEKKHNVVISLHTGSVCFDSCVGMATNMIGVKKRIIAFLDESGRAPTYTVMLIPEIVKKDGAYNAEEG